MEYIVLDVVAELDLSAIERPLQAKEHRGERPYAPRMSVAGDRHCPSGVAQRPDSMRARDHIAEAHARAGDHAHAVTAYRDVLACAARDTRLAAGAKDALRRKALAKLKDLSSAP